jgi:peroxin-19
MTTIDDKEDPFNQEGDFPAGNFNPDDIVDGMMEQLLSKDLMYEPMKQVADRYPAWLEANTDNLPETDLERYV